MPLSYGTLSHLWPSTAQESARSTPATRWRRAGAAAAHSPNAPSTWTHAPRSCATSQIASNGSLAPVFTLPAWRAHDRGRVAAEDLPERVGAKAPLLVGGDDDRPALT